MDSNVEVKNQKEIIRLWAFFTFPVTVIMTILFLYLDDQGVSGVWGLALLTAILGLHLSRYLWTRKGDYSFFSFNDIVSIDGEFRPVQTAIATTFIGIMVYALYVTA